MCGNRKDLIRMQKDVYVSSLKRLLDLDVMVLIMSHPFKPLGKSVLNGNETKEMLLVSIEIAQKPK